MENWLQARIRVTLFRFQQPALNTLFLREIAMLRHNSRTALSLLVLFSLNCVCTVCPANADFVVEKPKFDGGNAQSPSNSVVDQSADPSGTIQNPGKPLQGQVKQTQSQSLSQTHESSVKNSQIKKLQATASLSSTFPKPLQATVNSSSSSPKPLQATVNSSNPYLQGLHPFTAQAIAKTGAAGIQQTNYPNCWFEASLAAVAEVPRGQRVIAEMITQVSPDTYVVAFPIDRQPIYVSTQEIANHNLRDRASWAAILDCAAMKKFPDNDAADGPQFNRPKIKKGLELMTGESIQFVRPDTCSDEQLAAVIEQSVVAKQPIVMASKSPQENGHIIQVVTPNHAYTIMAYDSRTKIVTLRNPYGSATPSWAPDADPNEVSSSLVRELGQGLVQMNLGTIKYYFRYIAWPRASQL
jgi:hypothetical protein